MTTARRRPEPVTIEAFDRFVEGQADGVLFELLAGVVVMMDDPTEVHAKIEGNIGAPLKLAMDARGCLTFLGGRIPVQRSDNPRETNKTRPSVIVRCGPLGIKTYITDPLVVIEVLSPTGSDPAGLTPGSNAGCGMGSDPQGLTPAKLDFYKSLPTIRHIVLVYQDQMRVEHYRRSEQGFELDVLKRPEEFLHFEAVEFRIDLARIYFGVALQLTRAPPC